MDPGPLRDLLTLGLGLLTGAMSAAFGIGGAVISTPGIRLLGASAFVAVGTTLPSILPSAATGTARYSREQLVDWRVVAVTAPAGMVGAVGGSLASHAVPGDGHWLMVLTAVILGITAFRLARHDERSDEEAQEARDARRPYPPLAALLGLVAGGLSGLLGVGGGTVMVPGFAEVLKLPFKVAVATSLACVGILAIPGTITHAFLDDINWRLALLLAVAVVPGARLGAAAAIRTTDTRLRLVVAVFLGLVAVGYGAGEVVAALD